MWQIVDRQGAEPQVSASRRKARSFGAPFGGVSLARAAPGPRSRPAEGTSPTRLASSPQRGNMASSSSARVCGKTGRWTRKNTRVRSGLRCQLRRAWTWDRRRQGGARQMADAAAAHACSVGCRVCRLYTCLAIGIHPDNPYALKFDPTDDIRTQQLGRHCTPSHSSPCGFHNIHDML